MCDGEQTSPPETPDVEDSAAHQRVDVVETSKLLFASIEMLQKEVDGLLQRLRDHTDHTDVTVGLLDEIEKKSQELERTSQRVASLAHRRPPLYLVRPDEE